MQYLLPCFHLLNLFSSCATEDVVFNDVCAASCLPGYSFYNNETELSLTCQGGQWSLDDVSCLPICNTFPTAPANGSVHCDKTVCSIAVHVYPSVCIRLLTVS